MGNKTNLREEFIKDEVVWLDIDKPNASEVQVLSQTPNNLFTTVTGDGYDSWSVMTYRLSKKKVDGI